MVKTADGGAARALYRKLEQIELQGHAYTGITKLPGYHLWHIRGGAYRLYMQLGNDRVYIGAMRKKLRQDFPAKVYRSIEREVSGYRDSVERGTVSCDNEEV